MSQAVGGKVLSKSSFAGETAPFAGQESRTEASAQEFFLTAELE
jgi:hypothetical protein